VKVRQIITKLLRVIADEVECNPDFERRVAAALGLEEQPKADDGQNQEGEAVAAPPGQRPKNRRPPPVLDPVEVARTGEDALRTRLAALSIEQLKDIVAEFGMDPGKLVIKWKGADRIIDRIVEVSMSRAQKGDAFRSGI
jgi:hypothetical protein